jgi:hypothetical protein
MNYIQILQNASKYNQALYQDGSLYWSGDETLATPERKAIVKSDIQLIKDQLTVLEGALTVSK